MRTKLVLGLFSWGAVLAGPADARPRTTVMLVGSIHSFHGGDRNYGYQRLYDLVASFRPNVVGVEIRAEDIGANRSYLANSYPHEMIALRDAYADRVVGFDWLGDEIAGRPIPADWWRKKSRIKALERRIESDPMMHSQELDRLTNAELAIVKQATPGSLVDGRYAALVARERAETARLAGSGPYSPYVRFTASRERHIDDNLVRIVEANSGRRILFVMGADHLGYALSSLRKRFGVAIDLELPR